MKPQRHRGCHHFIGQFVGQTPPYRCISCTKKHAERQARAALRRKLAKNLPPERWTGYSLGGHQGADKSRRRGGLKSQQRAILRRLQREAAEARAS